METEEEVKNIQSKIIAIPSTNYMSIKLDNEEIKMYIQEDTIITEGNKDISFSDLGVGDKVDISYVKTGGFLIFEVIYIAKAIKVLQ